jgi:hypothetical protein
MNVGGTHSSIRRRGRAWFRWFAPDLVTENQALKLYEEQGVAWA